MAHTRWILPLLFIAVTSAAPTLPHQGASAVSAVIKAATDRGDVPGVAVAVVNANGLIYNEAAGKSRTVTNTPMARDTIFNMASMTKPITSVAIMMLVDEGKLKLDDNVAKYLPKWKDPLVISTFNEADGSYETRKAKRPITIRHLLTHTSGLGYPFTSAILRDFKPRAGESYVNGPLLFEPGERWHYGTSTDVVGRLVEKISGEKLEDYFLRHILGPLKMVDTSYNIPEAKAARVVASQQRDGERMDGKIVLQSPQPPLTVAMPIGGGGLTSTADDYGRFVRMLLNGGALDGVRVLKAETVALMGKNAIGDVSVPALKTAMPRSADFTFIADGRDKWGLGFLITADHIPGKRSAGSLSWGGINNTYYWIDPSSGLAGVIMMQYLPFADAKALAVYDAFERAVYRTLLPQH